MLFNSFSFLVFIVLFFFFYWFVTDKKLKLQNLLVVVASYVFYGWWDWRFLFLILFSTCVDFFVGKMIHNCSNVKKRKFLLSFSLIVNLGLLGFFKYFNFFVESFIEAFGVDGGFHSLNIILPVGISFYTFQTLSYTIDVYRKDIKASNNFIAFAAYVSFFPQLVAGPIERATNLLPQFDKQRKFEFEKALVGLRQVIWGLFKKVVVADNCAQYANEIFGQYQDYTSGTLILGAIYFSFQIYCDFSGYSDMAIGLARILGFDMKRNFNYPYFSRDVAEFWRRWHMSLSTWFRDYLYIPLGGSIGGLKSKIKNTLVVFFVSGLWHGANWTFVVWGILNALLFMPLLLRNKNRKFLNTVSENRIIPSFYELYRMLLTFYTITFTWVFFRSETISDSIQYLLKIGELTFQFERLRIDRFSFEIMPIVVGLVLFEWYNRFKEFPLFEDGKYFTKTFLVIVCILLFGSFSNVSEFIYFQF